MKSIKEFYRIGNGPWSGYADLTFFSPFTYFFGMNAVM